MPHRPPFSSLRLSPSASSRWSSSLALSPVKTRLARLSCAELLPSEAHSCCPSIILSSFFSPAASSLIPPQPNHGPLPYRSISSHGLVESPFQVRRNSPSALPIQPPWPFPAPCSPAGLCFGSRDLRVRRPMRLSRCPDHSLPPTPLCRLSRSNSPQTDPFLSPSPITASRHTRAPVLLSNWAVGSCADRPGLTSAPAHGRAEKLFAMPAL